MLGRQIREKILEEILWDLKKHFDDILGITIEK